MAKTYRRVWTGRKFKRQLVRIIDGGKVSRDTWAILDSGDVKGFLEAVLGREETA
ncbi:MAG: hypothetical protein H0S85_11125 [Desulfovibrionaceae bacterium]|jgi:hypothetical protein|nr:hypothetical protein [Desulfovibrionaceae bacterium]